MSGVHTSKNTAGTLALRNQTKSRKNFHHDKYNRVLSKWVELSLMKGHLFWGLPSTFYNTASSSTVCQKMLGLNTGLLRLRNRQSDAQTTWLDLIHKTARTHPFAARYYPHSAISHPNSARSHSSWHFQQDPVKVEINVSSPRKSPNFTPSHSSMIKHNRSIMFYSYFLY